MIKRFNNNIFGSIYHSDNDSRESRSTVKMILNIHLIYNVIVLISIICLHSPWSLLLSLFITHPKVEITDGKSFIYVTFWWLGIFKKYKTN